MRDADSSQLHKNWISGQRDGYTIRWKLSGRIDGYHCLGLRSSCRRGRNRRAACRTWAAWCLAVLEPCPLLHRLKAKLIFLTSVSHKIVHEWRRFFTLERNESFLPYLFPLCGADEMNFPSSCPGLHRAYLRARNVEAPCIGQSESGFG